MRSVSYRLADFENKKLVIQIGFVGENEFTKVNIDCQKVFKDHPSAVATLSVVPPSGDDYPAIVTRDGDIVTWEVTASDLVYDGFGEIQLTFTDGTKIGKEYKARTHIEDSIAGSGTAPTPVQNWIDSANEKLAAVEEATTEAESAASHAPRVGSTGYWEVWDAENEQYVATETKAQGDPGTAGHSPVITANKNGKTTVLYSDGQQIAQIVDGDDGDPTTLIDDTAGAGTTNKTLSADKITEVTTQLSTEIGELKPAATASDIGKALIVKTVADGVPTSYEYGAAGGGGAEIDDTAGAGDTDKVWSANKTVSEIQQIIVSGGVPIDDTAGEGDTNKIWSADRSAKEIDDVKYWDKIEKEPINGLGYVVKGNVNEEASLKSSSSWQYLKFDVSKYDKISVSTIIYGSTYYGVVFVNASNVIISKELVKGSDSAETITDQIVAVPANTKYAYVNEYSNVEGNYPVAKYLLTTSEIPELRNEVVNLDDSIIWRYLNGESVDNMRIGGNTGSAYTATGSSSWRYAKYDVTGHNYLKISTIIYGSSNFGYYFVASNNNIIEWGLRKGSNETETITDYVVKVPSTAKWLFVNKRSSTDGDSPFVKGVATVDEMSTMDELRIMSFNCGQFDYGDGSTTDAQYQANWRDMLNRMRFDICALQDYTTTFGQMQDEAKDILFGTTIKGFYGYVGSSEYGLRLASRINAGYLGCIDVGGGSGVWRSKVYKYSVFAMGKNIVVYVGHYQSQTEYATARATQYANVIADAQAYGYEYVVFVGDFNAASISEFAPFVNAGYVLCNGGYTGEHITLPEGEAGWENIPADNIIYSPNLMETHFEVLNDETLNTDHYPIFATLKVKS